TEIYTLSLHDALPISENGTGNRRARGCTKALGALHTPCARGPVLTLDYQADVLPDLFQGIRLHDPGPCPRVAFEIPQERSLRTAATKSHANECRAAVPAAA